MAIPVKNSETAWSVADFETHRPHLTKFVREKIFRLLDAENVRRILIRAPVKSGKREMVEYLSQRDNCHNPHRVHAFISSWHRVADSEQRDELSIHNLKVCSITTKTKAADCVTWIETKIAAGKDVVLHLDECDFGAGDRQILGEVYTTFHDNDKVTFILYSATPEEVLFSGEVDEKGEDEFNELVRESVGKLVKYTPPAGYCGPGRFLDEGLVKEALPFFYKQPDGSVKLSAQGATIVNDLREGIKTNPRRNIILLRLSSSDLEGKAGQRKEYKKIYQFFNGVGKCAELGDFTIVADKSEKDVRSPHVLKTSIQWSNPKYWQTIATGVPMIFVIDQTASRSTEFVCHDRLFAYHDFRNTVVFSTISQAQERVNHYEQRYGGFQPIHVYGHTKTFELSADRIDYNTYMQNPWKKQKIDHRIVTRSSLGENCYRILSSTDNSIHPIHKHPVTSEEADRILQELASFVEIKVSARVRGRIAYRPQFDCKFVPCGPETFDGGDAERALKQTIKEMLPHALQGHRFQNPFIRSLLQGLENGKFKGIVRDEYKVFDFEDTKKEAGAGVIQKPRLTICYRDGMLGVALRYNTGLTLEENTLETFKSMYKV